MQLLYSLRISDIHQSLSFVRTAQNSLERRFRMGSVQCISNRTERKDQERDEPIRQ